MKNLVFEIQIQISEILLPEREQNEWGRAKEQGD